MNRTRVADLDRERARRRQPPIVEGRAPPHDVEAEAAVLSTAILKPDELPRLVAMLGASGEAFYNDANGLIWEAIVALSARNAPVDLIQIRAELAANGVVDRVGGSAYLAHIIDATPAVAHAVAHARIVVDRARLRRVIALMQERTAFAYDNPPDAGEFIRETSRALEEASRASGVDAEPSTIGEAEVTLAASLKSAREALALGNSGGYRMGIEPLDHMTGGLYPTKVHYLSAPRKGRKSTVAVSVAVHVATSLEKIRVDKVESEYRRGVAYFPLEMTAGEIAMVASCQIGNVEGLKFLKGTATDDDYARREFGSKAFGSLPIIVDDRPGLSIATLRPRIREARAKLRRLLNAPLRLVVIDTMQLFAMRTPHRPHDEQSIIDATGAAIRELSLDPEFALVSWLIVSQLNGEGLLRGSRALEQHLTQWIDLRVKDNDSAWTGNPHHKVATFTVKLWREGPSGDDYTVSTWLDERTGRVGDM